MSNLKAVLVGINNYKGNGDLNGCVNDVLYMRDILRQKYKVEESDIRVIVDQYATTEAIEERIAWLIAQSNTTKNLVFWYSGHGTQVPNQDYADIEDDGMDELICPHDFDFRGRYITDDVIRKLITSLNPAAKLTMVFDCCHSGSITRELTFNNPIPYKNRYLPPPPDLLCRSKNVDATALVHKDENRLFDSFGLFREELFWDIDGKFGPERGLNYKKRSAMIDVGKELNVVAITGCKDNQTSADAHFYNRYQGALSFALQKCLIEDPCLPASELHRRTLGIIKKFGFEQEPVLATDKEVFNGQPFICAD